MNGIQGNPKPLHLTLVPSLSGVSEVNRPVFKNTIIPCFVPLKFCISIVPNFSWDDCKSQEKLKTMLMQNFGGTTKKYYGIFENGLYNDFVTNSYGESWDSSSEKP